MSNVGALVVSLEANIAKFQSDMGKAAAVAEARAREIDKSIGIVKTGLASLGVGFALGASFEAIKGKIDGAIASAAGLQQMSERTGATVEALSGLVGIAKLSGTGTDELAGGLQKLSKSLIDAQNGGQKTSASFAAIGISAKDLKGASPEQLFQRIAKELDHYQDGAEKVVIAQNLLGKAGANLLPVLKDLAEAGDLQVKVTAEQAAMADELEKNQIRLKASTDAIYKKIGLEVIPVFNAFTKALLDTQNANDGIKKGIDGLAKDGSIRTWAEDAAKFVGFVIDAFDGVARTIQIVGKGLGATAAAAVAVSKGEFSEARSIMQAYVKDADEIANKELFSTRLKKRLEEASKTPVAPSARVRISTAGLGNANAGGPVDDPAKKLLEGQIKNQEALIAAEKTQLATREQYLQSFYNQEYLTASDYYGTKNALIQSALVAELAAYDKESAAVAIYAAQAVKEVDRQEAKNKQAEISKKRVAAEIDSNKKLTDSVLEQAKIYRDFDLATSAIARNNKLANDQMQLAIDLLGKNTLEVAQITEAKKIQLALEQRLYDMRNKNLPQTELERAVAESEAQKLAVLALIEESYKRQRQSAFGAGEAVRKYTEDAANNAAQIENLLINAFKGAEDALVNFVKTGKLDFRSLADSIISDLIRIQARQIISSGASGLGGLLGNLFSGGTAGNNPSAFTSNGGILSSLGSLFSGFHFADGGSPPVGLASLVGERGPELFVPSQAGTIVPNHMLQGGSGGENITIVNQTTGRIDKVVTQQVSPGERAIYIQEAHDAVAAAMYDPNSRVSRAMSQNFNSRRQR